MSLRNVTALICTLLAGLLANAPARATTPMTFFMDLAPEKRWAHKMTSGVEDIYASGEITEGTADRLLTFVRQNKVEAAKIHFNSPGGSLAEGMKLGRVDKGFQP